jgi:hypothetical protein
MTLGLVFVCAALSLAMAHRAWEGYRLRCLQRNVVTIWQLVDDNPLLGRQTMAEIHLFNQIIHVMLERACDSLWPDIRRRAHRLQIGLQTAPEIVGTGEVSAGDIERLRRAAERLALT